MVVLNTDPNLFTIKYTIINFESASTIHYSVNYNSIITILYFIVLIHIELNFLLEAILVEFKQALH